MKLTPFLIALLLVTSLTGLSFADEDPNNNDQPSNSPQTAMST